MNNNDIAYCGTRVPIPAGYDRNGTPYECLRKGVGVGKFLKCQKTPRLMYTMVITIVFVILDVCLTILVFLVMMRKQMEKDKIDSM